MQEDIDQVPKKGILVVQGDWNAKIGEDASNNWKAHAANIATLRSTKGA